MNDIAISVENLTKRYKIGLADKSHDTLRDYIAGGFRSLLSRNKETTRVQRSEACETFWALEDVTFNINKGETVGFIGRNGAGKSTLLKILSRITEPTSGVAKIHGRVASLLEVGTGFHGELTGRENIYLNGAILGMKTAEIGRKFDEIVAFAEVAKFIDTPVKHYSSGMHLRLAFAVAAHLEPEILIVDEVLAVGDANFQAKCLDKMEDVRQGGRTVLFVSHNMSAVTRLCGRTIFLEKGRIVADAPSHQVVRKYLEGGIGIKAGREWLDPAKAPGGPILRLRSVRIRTENGATTEVVDIRRPVAVDMEYQVIQPGHVLSPWYEFFNQEGVEVFSAVDLDPAWHRRPRPPGVYRSTAWIPGNLLSEGTFFVRVGMATMNPQPRKLLYERDVVAFQVYDTMEGDSARGDWTEEWGGVIRPWLKWETQYSPDPIGGGVQSQKDGTLSRTGSPV